MIAIFAMLIVQIGFAATPVYSKKIIQQVCEKVEKEYYRKGFRKKSCLKQKMVFSKKPVQLKIKGIKKPLTTMMFIRFEEANIKFEVILKAKLEISAKGQLHRTGWAIDSINPISYGDKSILRNSWSSSSNVIELRSAKDLPRNIATILKKFDFEADFEYRHASDFESGDPVYFKITHPKTKKVLGYLVHVSFGSESEDIKEFSYYKFDKAGKYVDVSTEGYGYHE